MTPVLRLPLYCLPTLAVAALIAAAPATAQPEAEQTSIEVLIKVRPQGVRDVRLLRQVDGSYAYRLQNRDGTTLTLTPVEYAKRLHDDRSSRGWVYAFLNITSPIGFAWVAFGLIAQVLFTGRMIVQWLISEKHKRSVVPVAFWWMSLAGATMLIIYFIWRKDIVGVLGQSAGWFIYVRNLILIYRNLPPEAVD